MSDVISAAVYGPDGVTHIADLPSSSARTFTRDLNDVGQGSLQISFRDLAYLANPSLRAYGNIIRLTSDEHGDFSYIIEKPSLPKSDASEAAGRDWVLAGRGVLALLEDELVRPESLQTNVYERTFGWMASSFDDSGAPWTTATQIQRQDATGPIVEWPGFPSGWREHTAYWIWSQALTAGPPQTHPVGTSYFRKSFTLASETYLTFIATCDNAFRLWLDDQVIMDFLDPLPSRLWAEMERYSRVMPAGTHQLAAECYNASAGGENPGGFILAAYTLTDVGAIDTVYVHTDSTWRALDYPASAPGMTPGAMLQTLLQEGQALGAFVGITWDFDPVNDSNGAPWPTLTKAFTVGSSVLDAARTLVEQSIDIEMGPDLVLHAYLKGTLGTDLTGSVTLQVGVDFEELKFDGEAHLANAALGRDQTGALYVFEDATSLAARKRQAVYVEVATAPNETALQEITSVLFTEFARPVTTVTGQVKKSAGMFTTWDLGDQVKMPGLAADDVDTTITSIIVSEDSAGHMIRRFQGLQYDGS